MTSSPTATFTFDNNGNTLTKADSTGTTSYAWDFENRLTSVTLPGTAGTASFRYDPFGRRIQKSSSSGTTNYLYDGSNSLEEVDATGNVLARYTGTQNTDEPLAMLRSGVTSYYQADGLGSITSLSNATGTLANTYTTTPSATSPPRRAPSLILSDTPPANSIPKPVSTITEPDTTTPP